MGPFVTLNLLWILKVNQIINSVVFLCKIITELGAVAQLGERVVRNDEVGGSNPPSSTNSIHEFRKKNGSNHQQYPGRFRAGTDREISGI